MGNLVVKSNALIEASYSLNVVEQRVILLAILKARELGIEIGLGTVVRVYADNYAHTYGISKDMSYKALKSAVLELINAKFRWVEQTKKGLKYTISNFMDTVSYIEGEGCVELIFGSQLIPQITDLTRLFTSYEIEQTRNLNRYGLRLYELLVRWRATGKVVVTLAELRSRLGLLDDEYKAMGDFKKRVLDMAVAEINEHTDIDVKYEQQKQGRKIVGFTFSFKQKKDKQKSIIKMTNKQRLMFAKKLANLPELGSYAPIGASTDDYANKIADELLDPTKSDFYKPFLDRVGF